MEDLVHEFFNSDWCPMLAPNSPVLQASLPPLPPRFTVPELDPFHLTAGEPSPCSCPAPGNTTVLDGEPSPRSAVASSCPMDRKRGEVGVRASSTSSQISSSPPPGLSWSSGIGGPARGIALKVASSFDIEFGVPRGVPSKGESVLRRRAERVRQTGELSWAGAIGTKRSVQRAPSSHK